MTVSRPQGTPEVQAEEIAILPSPWPPATVPELSGARPLLTLLLAWFITGGILSAAPATFIDLLKAKRAGKPNIILIVADDLGYGDLGCYGQPRIRTPYLDRLAGEGVRFTHYYAGSPDDGPSRAALLTGYHTGREFIRDARRTFAIPTPTLAPLLQEAGYKTCAVGFWGLGENRPAAQPTQQGFEEWLGYLTDDHAHDYYPLFLWRNDRRHKLLPNVGGHPGQYAPDVLTSAVINFIRTYAKYPLFVYFAITLPRANPDLGALSGNGMQIPTPHAYSEANWPEPERNKAAMISRLDDSVGQILELLDTLKLAGDTVVFFTSDTGPHAQGGVDPAFFSSSGPFRGSRGDCYEGGLRVPMIVRWKDHIPAGKVSAEPWAHWDFLPTALALAQTNAPGDLDGISMAPTLLGQPQTNRHDFLFWRSNVDGAPQALRQQQWKLVVPAALAPPELYDLQADAGERRDLAHRYPDVLNRLQDLLQQAGSARDAP